MNVNNNNNNIDVEQRLNALNASSIIRKSDIDVQEKVLNSVFDSANDVNNDKEFGEPTLKEEKELSPFKKAVNVLLDILRVKKTNKAGETSQTGDVNSTAGSQAPGELVAGLTTESTDDKVGYYDHSQIEGDTITTGDTTVKVSSNGVSAQENGQDVGGVEKRTGNDGKEYLVLADANGKQQAYDPEEGEFLPENEAQKRGLI